MSKVSTECDLTDQTLVELTQHGNREAFGELIYRHRDRCIGLAFLLLGNRGDAEDGVQNALSKAYVHLDQYRGEAKFSTWLTRIVVHEALARSVTSARNGCEQDERAVSLGISSGHGG